MAAGYGFADYGGMTLRSGFLACLASLVFAGAALAQAPVDPKLRGKEIKGRDLEWSDFTGDVDQRSPLFAYTYWSVLYRFDRPVFRDGRAYIKPTVQLFFLPRSWVRPDRESAELLEHERGHFKIGRLCARLIESALTSAEYSPANYQKETAEVYSSTAAKCKDVESQYDLDTRHSANRERQAAWNQKLSDMLKD
ncbi:MAG TPA: hypothetical protein VL501_05215 [Pyrinomonadaceae bacterium]|nr:hypothetical protein [Pyrinomonadaceae bacterium]